MITLADFLPVISAAKKRAAEKAKPRTRNRTREAARRRRQVDWPRRVQESEAIEARAAAFRERKLGKAA